MGGLKSVQITKDRNRPESAYKKKKQSTENLRCQNFRMVKLPTKVGAENDYLGNEKNHPENISSSKHVFPIKSISIMTDSLSKMKFTSL